MLIQTLQNELKDKLSLLNNRVERDAGFSTAANKIKVAIGMRRSGKTHLIYQKILTLLQSGVDLNQILYINFEDDRLLPLSREKLSQLVDEFYSQHPNNYDSKCYLFFDEIQNVPEWPIVIRRLQDSKQVEIYLTGSSAKLLSKEIATSLRGRSLSVEVWPYSFNEYKRAKNIIIDENLHSQKTIDNLKKHFITYLFRGGFPEVIDYNKYDNLQTLQEYVDVVIYRDIIERHQIKNPALVKYLIIFMLSNISRPLSINKIYNTVKSLGYKTSKDSIYQYIDYIEDAYLCFSTPFYDDSIKKIQSNPKKIYAIDTGIVNSVTANFDSNIGKLFENAIFIDLKRMGCDIFYYLTEKNRYEIDFVVKTPNNQFKLIQVCWEIQNDAVAEREIRALETAKQELGYPGYILTLEEYLQHGVKLD